MDSHHAIHGRRVQFSLPGAQSNFRSYFLYYLIGFSILAGIMCLLFICCRWIRFWMESSSSHEPQQHQQHLQQHPTMTTLEQEESALLVEFNEKLVVARKNSIATVLPIEICTETVMHSLDQHHSSSTCSICLEPFLLGEELRRSNNSHCIHVFHSMCVYHWLIRNDPHFICPMCRCPFLEEA